MAGRELERPPPTLEPQIEFPPAVELDKPSERCGIVGIRTVEPVNHFNNLILAGYGVQHRGQLGAGVRLVQYDEEIYLHTGDGLISKVFTDDFIEDEVLMDIAGKLSGFHGRYGTEGNYGEGNHQPITGMHHDTDEEIAVFHNGQFVDIDRMRSEVGDDYKDGMSDTHLFTEILAQSEGENWDERILSTIDKVDGAYNLIIHIGDTMYVARDGFGLHPLERGIISIDGIEGVIVASETSAFNETGAKHERPVRRGEVFKVDDNGAIQLREGFEPEDDTADRSRQECALEFAYFQRSDSLDSEGRALALTRRGLGAIVAERIVIPGADFVVGIPDSGTDFASGYANTLGLPFENFIQRNRYSPHATQRAFQNDYDIPGIRDIVAKKLLYVEGDHWEDTIVVVGDDSIFRGSGGTEVTEKIFGFGAKEVHIVVGFPPVRHSCHLAISIRTIEELVANQGDVADKIGATSVNYILPEEYTRGVRDSEYIESSDPSLTFLENGLCGGCVTGVHPITKEGEIWRRTGDAKEPEFTHR